MKIFGRNLEEFKELPEIKKINEEYEKQGIRSLNDTEMWLELKEYFYKIEPLLESQYKGKHAIVFFDETGPTIYAKIGDDPRELYEDFYKEYGYILSFSKPVGVDPETVEI